MNRLRYLLILGLALPCAAAPSVGVQAMKTSQSFQTSEAKVDTQGALRSERQAIIDADRTIAGDSMRPDPDWTKRMVRPCARSGNRLVC